MKRSDYALDQPIPAFEAWDHPGPWIYDIRCAYGVAPSTRVTFTITLGTFDHHLTVRELWISALRVARNYDPRAQLDDVTLTEVHCRAREGRPKIIRFTKAD